MVIKKIKRRGKTCYKIKGKSRCFKSFQRARIEERKQKRIRRR